MPKGTACESAVQGWKGERATGFQPFGEGETRAWNSKFSGTRCVHRCEKDSWQALRQRSKAMGNKSFAAKVPLAIPSPPRPKARIQPQEAARNVWCFLKTIWIAKKSNAGLFPQPIELYAFNAKGVAFIAKASIIPITHPKMPKRDDVFSNRGNLPSLFAKIAELFLRFHLKHHRVWHLEQIIVRDFDLISGTVIV